VCTDPASKLVPIKQAISITAAKCSILNLHLQGWKKYLLFFVMVCQPHSSKRTKQ